MAVFVREHGLFRCSTLSTSKILSDVMCVRMR